MSTNENTPISGQFWDWMQSYWHSNRDFPPAHPDWRKKADLVNGKVPAGQLPSYVDDVLEFSSYADLPQSGEKGKIYITTKDNKQFRWGGSAYIEINSGEKVGSKIINGSYNANDLSTNSITYGYSVANAPSTVGAHSFSILNLDTTNPDYKMQLGFDGDTNEMFSRIKSNGYWTDWSKYAASSQLGNVVTTNTSQEITGTKIFLSSGNGFYNNTLQVYSDGSVNASMSFYKEDFGVAQLSYDGDGFHTVDAYGSDHIPFTAKAFKKSNSDDSYLLLGGGGHKSLSEFMTTNTSQDVTGTKSYVNSSGNSSLYDNKLHVKGTNGSKAGISFWSDDVGQLTYFNTGFHFKNQFDTAYQFAKASAFIKDGSDNSYILLGGGGHKPISEFVAPYQLDNYIPKTHPSYGITQNYLDSWFAYKGYEDVRVLRPQNIETTKLQFGFTSYNNDGTAPWADFVHFGGYPDASGGNQNLISFKKNGFGLRQWQGTPQSPVTYQSFVDYWNTGNFDPNKKVSSNNSTYSIDWDGFQTYLLRNDVIQGYFFHSGNFNPGNYVDRLYDQEIAGLKTFTGVYNAWLLNNDISNARGFVQSLGGRFAVGTTNDKDLAFYRNVEEKVVIGDSETKFNTQISVPDATSGYHAVNLNQLSGALNNYFNKFAIDYTGPSKDLNSLSQTGFYNIGFGTINDAASYVNNNGARALLHFQNEDYYSAMQVQTHKYKGNLISRNKTDGYWSAWVRHWGDNDFTAADVSKWNNSISKSSASEEVILEDDTLKIQPDELSLEGSGSYDIASRKKLVHVLLREGKEVNIRELVRRQTMVVFNFSKDPVSLNIEGLKPYALSSGMQVTLYISDEGEVLLYNETGFKKLQ